MRTLLLLITAFAIPFSCCTEQKDVVFDVDDYISMGAPSILIIPEGYEQFETFMYKDGINYSDKVEEVQFPSTMGRNIGFDTYPLSFDVQSSKYSIDGLRNLKKIDLSFNNNYIVENGVLYSSDKEIIFGTIPSLVPKTLEVSSRTKFMIGTFAHCDNIETLILSDSILHIPRAAFSCCANLKHLSLPNSLESIYYDAIDGSEKLDSLYLPNSLMDHAIYNNAICASNLKIYISSDHPDKERLFERYNTDWSEVLVVDPCCDSDIDIAPTL